MSWHDRTEQNKINKQISNQTNKITNTYMDNYIMWCRMFTKKTVMDGCFLVFFVHLFFNVKSLDSLRHASARSAILSVGLVTTCTFIRWLFHTVRQLFVDLAETQCSSRLDRFMALVTGYQQPLMSKNSPDFVWAAWICVFFCEFKAKEATRTVERTYACVSNVNISIKHSLYLIRCIV